MKTVSRWFIIAVVGVIMGICFNVVAFLCPDRLIHENVLNSIETFQIEGAFPMPIPHYMSTRLDNNSDAWMLLMADYTNDEKTIFEKAVGGFYKIYSEDSNLLGQASLTAMGEPVREIDGGYARYWHGWLLPLRLLLTFFTYDDIRYIGMIAQYGLMISIFLLLQKRKVLNYGLGVFAMFITICPIVSCISLEYTFIFYISTISSIFILKFHEKLLNKGAYSCVFLIIGMSTSYFDFLTYPVVALGMPILFLLILLRKNAINWKKQLGYVIGCSTMWGIGYIGFWGVKWIIASLILKENVIMSAIRQVNDRAGNISYDGAVLSYAEVIRQNLELLQHNTIILMFVGIAIVVVWKNIHLKEKINKDFCSVSPFLLVMLYPFIWYFFTKNHSFIHYHFTYRNLAISVFAFYCFLESLFDKKGNVNNG